MRTVVGQILELAHRDPDRIFARGWDARSQIRELSYGEMVLRGSGVARRLHDAGVREGDPVVVIIKDCIDLLSCWLAPLLIGAVPTLFAWPTEKLSRDYYEKSIARLLDIIGATALLTSEEIVESLRPLSKDAPRLRAILTVEGTEVPAQALIPPDAILKDPETISVLQHSSGSTGLQKGVALSSRAIFNQIDHEARALRITDSDRYANWMPLYHDAGLIGGFLMPLLLRLPLSIVGPMDWVRDPALLLHMITRDRATVCWLPNFAYKFMATRISPRRLEGVDLSSMRIFVNTAEPVRASSHKIFMDKFAPLGLHPLALTACYAMAENVLAVSQTDPTKPTRVDVIDRAAFARDDVATPPAPGQPGIDVVSGGTLLPNVKLKVFDKDFNELPDRRIGELAIQSDCMLTGYWNRPDLTEQAFHDGWYMTGDFGYTAEGEVFPTGRKKDLIIVGGNNIYPQDLEWIADHTPGVHPGRTVAFGVDNELGTEDVVVIVETEEGHDAETVSAAVKAAIAKQSECVARTVHVVPPMWLIKTSSGKISRTRCKEKFLQETSSAT